MITAETYPYRAFISYARDDAEYAQRLVNRLRELSLQPVWDQGNPRGQRFLDKIKTQIAHAHVFIPLLTSKAGQSSWVNQEIGYAIGRDIPVLPLSLGYPPEGMVAGIQAVTASDIESLLQGVIRSQINLLVEDADTIAVHEFADLVQTRTDAIIKHCKEVEPFYENSLGPFLGSQRQPLRHRAAFGSFSLPSSASDSLWLDRYDGQPDSDRLHRIKKLSEERRHLERYAVRFGCDLVLYPNLPHLTRKSIGSRIRTIRNFLAEMLKGPPVQVVFDRSALGQNVLIAGDWFFADSIAPKSEGYRHTTISCHAPTVYKQMEEFDTQFRAYNNIMSAKEAIQWLDERPEGDGL